jgi:glycerol-3-phosphate acyltransferase PlsY
LQAVPRIRGVPLHAYIITAVLAYLLGSIPTGYLVARAKGVDIRHVGSGNIGATNAFRVLGKGWGLGVLLLDFGKGLTACLGVPAVVRAGLNLAAGSEGAVTLALVAAVAAVLGHNFTVWLRFKGGKGIATSAGALAALVPWALLIGAAVWGILFGLTRYVSLGSIGAAIALPVATWLTTGGDWPLTILTGVLGLMALLKHRSNMKRLLAGTENRLEFGKPRKGECG